MAKRILLYKVSGYIEEIFARTLEKEFETIQIRHPFHRESEIIPNSDRESATCLDTHLFLEVLQEGDLIIIMDYPYEGNEMQCKTFMRCASAITKKPVIFLGSKMSHSLLFVVPKNMLQYCFYLGFDTTESVTEHIRDIMRT